MLIYNCCVIYSFYVFSAKKFW